METKTRIVVRQQGNAQRQVTKEILISNVEVQRAGQPLPPVAPGVQRVFVTVAQASAEPRPLTVLGWPAKKVFTWDPEIGQLRADLVVDVSQIAAQSLSNMTARPHKK